MLHLIRIYCTRAPRGENNDSDDSDEDDEEEESEESEEEEEDPAAGGSAEPQVELTRAEKRELKKKQAAQKQQDEDEDPDLVNPNHVGKKLNISDLSAPRELSRRERYEIYISCLSYLFSNLYIHLTENRRRSKKLKIVTGRYVLDFIDCLHRCQISYFLCFLSSICKERLTRLRRI